MVVHRHHRHKDLTEDARHHGVELFIDAHVNQISYTLGPGVDVSTEKGATCSLDLIIGSDGVTSVVRKTLFPNMQIRPPTINAAYRALVPQETLNREVPEAKELSGNNINLLMLEKGLVMDILVFSANNTLVHEYFNLR